MQSSIEHDLVYSSTCESQLAILHSRIIRVWVDIFQWFRLRLVHILEKIDNAIELLIVVLLCVTSQSFHSPLSCTLQLSSNL